MNVCERKNVQTHTHNTFMVEIECHFYCHEMFACTAVTVSAHSHTHTSDLKYDKKKWKKITKEFQFFHCFVLMFMFYHRVFASLLKICSHNSILSVRFRFFWAYGAKMLSKCQQMCDNSNCDTTEVYLAFSGKLSFVFGHTQNYHHADHFMLRRKIINTI